MASNPGKIPMTDPKHNTRTQCTIPSNPPRISLYIKPVTENILTDCKQTGNPKKNKNPKKLRKKNKKTGVLGWGGRENQKTLIKPKNKEKKKNNFPKVLDLGGPPQRVSFFFVFYVFPMILLVF
jgi:hypothetical protein